MTAFSQRRPPFLHKGIGSRIKESEEAKKRFEALDNFIKGEPVHDGKQNGTVVGKDANGNVLVKFGKVTRAMNPLFLRKGMGGEH
jgi:hypothetical protein